ncbi:16096_t:CDS:1, partial [Cetraspora pellucida]
MIIETDIDSTAEKDSEVTTQRIENAQATTSQNAIPDNEENNNKMETES